MGTGHNWPLVLSLIYEDAKRRRMNASVPNLRKDGLQDRPSADEFKLPTERLGPF